MGSGQDKAKKSRFGFYHGSVMEDGIYGERAVQKSGGGVIVGQKVFAKGLGKCSRGIHNTSLPSIFVPDVSRKCIGCVALSYHGVPSEIALAAGWEAAVPFL